MNIFKLFIAMLIAVSAMTASATNPSNENNQKSNTATDSYFKWKVLYDKCSLEYDTCISIAENEGEKKLKKLKMTREEFESYEDLCKKLKPSIKQMDSATDFSTPIEFDIDKWYELSCKFKDAIKNDIKDLEKNSDETWEKYCDCLKEQYFELNKKYNTAMLDHAKGLISKNKEQENEIKILNDTIFKLRDIEKQYNDIKKKKQTTINNLDDAFRACVYFPLAVKYNETYTPLAYKAAKSMYSNPQIPQNAQVQKEWKDYEPLLRDYNKYNQSVIRFIEDIQQKISQNGENPLNPSYYEDVLKNEGYEYSKYYNNTKVSIKHLDNVLNEFFTLLDDYAKKGTKPSEKFFQNFILKNLK